MSVTDHFVFDSEATANECCREWQKILRLQDWDVKVSIQRERDIQLNYVQGECSWKIKSKRAIITLLDPLDYPPDAMCPQNHEMTLIHELLHLHFAPFSAEDKTPEDIAQEQAINALSRALLMLKRGDSNSKEANLQNS